MASRPPFTVYLQKRLSMKRCNNSGNIEYIERISHLKDDEVLLKIKAAAFAGTDIHAFAGRQPFLLPIRACWVMKFAAWLNVG